MGSPSAVRTHRWASRPPAPMSPRPAPRFRTKRLRAEVAPAPARHRDVRQRAGAGAPGTNAGPCGSRRHGKFRPSPRSTAADGVGERPLVQVGRDAEAPTIDACDSVVEFVDQRKTCTVGHSVGASERVPRHRVGTPLEWVLRQPAVRSGPCQPVAVHGGDPPPKRADIATARASRRLLRRRTVHTSTQRSTGGPAVEVGDHLVPVGAVVSQRRPERLITTRLEHIERHSLLLDPRVVPEVEDATTVGNRAFE